MRRLVATVTLPGIQPSPNWWSVAQGIVRRADEKMWKRYGDELHRLLVPQLRAPGAAPDIPEYADPAVLAHLLGTGRSAISCWLVQDAASGYLVLQGEPAGTRQSPLGAAVTLDAGGVRVIVAGHGPARWLSPGALPARLAPLGEPTELHVDTAHQSVYIAAIRRPQGAFGWGCDRSGITVRSAEFGEWHPFGQWNFPWSELRFTAAPPPPGAPASAPWALEAAGEPRRGSNGEIRFGIDRRFGVYVDLTVATKHGRATQRLRWIEPGTS